MDAKLNSKTHLYKQFFRFFKPFRACLTLISNPLKNIFANFFTGFCVFWYPNLIIVRKILFGVFEHFLRTLKPNALKTARKSEKRTVKMCLSKQKRSILLYSIVNSPIRRVRIAICAVTVFICKDLWRKKQHKNYILISIHRRWCENFAERNEWCAIVHACSSFASFSKFLALPLKILEKCSEKLFFFGKCFGFRDSFCFQPSYKAGMDGWVGS